MILTKNTRKDILYLDNYRNEKEVSIWGCQKH